LSAEWQRLAQLVELDHRARVAAASVADSRYRPRDKLVRVKVVQPFRVNGREAVVNEIVEVPTWLLAGLRVTGHAEKV
jgi:hypothetical protein